jgi:hypothetical protein
MGRFTVILVGLNVLACTALFWWCCRPRETLSGLAGRYAARGSRFASVAARVIDAIFWFDPDHCREVARLEAAAFEVLGYGG